MVGALRFWGCVLARLFLVAITGGCVLTQPTSIKDMSEQPFRPPTAIASPATSAPEEPTAKPTPPTDCTDQLTFIADVTIPDGTSVAPESTLDKRWEVENRGTCNWDERYQMRLIAGSHLGASPDQALFPARSGSRAVIRIQFTAPAETGVYRSAWQAVNPAGQPFGDPIYIEIIVTAP